MINRKINDSKPRKNRAKHVHPWRRRIHPEKIRNTLPDYSSGKNHFRHTAVKWKTKKRVAVVSSL
jgi:hypothetical protein